MATTIENLRAFGEEIRRQRIAKGIKTLVQLKDLTGISTQFLSQIEKAYVNKDRGLVIPSDDKIEKLSQALEIPLSRLHALLGRMPDQPLPIYKHPETVQIADDYDGLPSYARKIVRDALKTAKEVVAQIENGRGKSEASQNQNN